MKMQNKTEALILWLTAASAVSLVASNLLAVKLTSVLGIAVDCGILLYPITYVLGDISAEFFGQRRANLIVIIGATLNVAVTAFLLIAVLLPPHPGWTGQAGFASVFGFMPRVVAGSICAYVASGLVNNYLFDRIRERHPGQSARQIAGRTLGSSLLAHAADSLIFECVAFLGVLPLGDFVKQALLAYCASLVLETAFFPCITQPVILRLHLWLRRE